MKSIEKLSWFVALFGLIGIIGMSLALWILPMWLMIDTGVSIGISGGVLMMATFFGMLLLGMTGLISLERKNQIKR